MDDHGAGRNPLLPPDVHMPDAEARVMPDGRLYLYGSLDATTERYCSDRYLVASSSDLRAFTVHDTSLQARQVPWAGVEQAKGRSFLDGATSYEDLPAYARAYLPDDLDAVPFEAFAAQVRAATAERQSQTALLYAPDAIERDGRYYLYFCMSDDSEGVAVADSPEGPFTEPTRLPITGIDPSVFIDDDGQAYLYWGQFSANVAKLDRDMTTIDMASIREGIATESEHHFHEGSSMRKRGDTYYLVFADTSRGRPTCLGYATSSSPLGPFAYRGVIIDNADCDPESWNNHGSIECVDGRWYVFYHRSSRGSASMRRVCAEPIEFSDDGSIAEVPMTSQGPGMPYSLGEWIPGWQACAVDGGARVEPVHQRESLVLSEQGDGASWRYLEVSGDCRVVQARIDGPGEVDVIVDGAPVARLNQATASAPATIEAGRHDVAVELVSGPGPVVLRALSFDA